MKMFSKRKKLFVSHCSSDMIIMNRLTPLLNELFQNVNVHIFNTSNEKTGTDIGKGLSDTLRKNLADSDLMIAVITDNYIRSIKCISEITAFWFLSHKVLPIVFNEKRGIDFLNSLFGQELIYLEPGNLSADECAVKLYRTFQSYRFPLGFSEASFHECFIEFFSQVRQESSERPYIGSDQVFYDIVQYCESNGIEKITDHTLELSTIIDRLRKYDEIYILSTTGANLISGLSTSFLEEALLNRKNLTVLIPNKYSAFCTDVAEIESPTDTDGNLRRLANAFDDIMTNLQRCIDAAASKSKGRPIGHIFVGCAYTILRQTITLGVSGTSFWGWLSITVPPNKTNDKTPSLSFYGSDETHTFGDTILNHVKKIRELAESRGDLHEILPNGKKLDNFYLEPYTAKQYWRGLQAKAKNNMLFHHTTGSGALIEVAANHPLREGRYPSEEFSSRLDYAVSLYRHLFENNARVKIYVPGSRHRFNDHTDTVSLSKAGKEYLLKQGIPPSDILGEEENDHYKGESGVYNSADECFVASKIYLDQDFQKLYCVCSPNQMPRKKLFYMAFGVTPDFYTVPSDNSAHDDVYELLEALPDVIYYDHTWQESNSKNGIRTRAERIPTV